MDGHWVTSALHTGTLGTVALHLDRGRVPLADDASSVAAAIVHRYGIRSSSHLDDQLIRYRDTYYHLLPPGLRCDLVRCINRNKDETFGAVASMMPALRQYLNQNTPSSALRGGGTDEIDLETQFERTFGDDPVQPLDDEQQGVGRRRPSKMHEGVKWNEALGEDVLSAWSEASEFLS